ncbi:MAG TPA: HlyD family efflux transporter periplasmic adaptor subunit [Gammaproteobacteria bacterium]|nr:HlyD family efflux transporter periplasmic adaptor subunit [Gammaproteobacteria bacterium]
MMSLKRKTGFIVIALAIAAALAWGFWPAPLLVERATVKRAPLSVTIEEEGITRVKDRFVISTPVAGYLQRITLEVGDVVQQGQILALMEPLRPDVLDVRSRALAEAKVSAARAAVKSAEQKTGAARAEAEYARNDHARKKQLQGKALVSREELEQAATRSRQAAAELRSAEFAVEVARFELEAAQTALRYSISGNGDTAAETVALKAPTASRVLQLHHESEGVVTTGEPLMEIGDPAALEIAVDVLSADAVRIRPGTAVKLLRWGGPQSLDAVVRTVEPTGFTRISALGVEEQRVWVIADLVSPRAEWEQLGDGYRVEAKFLLWQEGDVLQVPASALFRVGDDWSVFVAENGKARLRTVSVGRSSGLVTQVLDGLQAGEEVILHPDDRIGEGVRVEVK